MATAPASSPLELDVEQNALRFSNALHLLRELVHQGSGRLALEPRLEAKYALADHLHDDARSVAKLERRLRELGASPGHPGAPGERLAMLLDTGAAARTPAAYADHAYGVLKPGLIAALRVHLAALDPLADEPSMRLLTQVLHRQERHVVELSPSSPASAPVGDLGALAIRPGELRALPILPRVDAPARDAYLDLAVERGSGDGCRVVHDLMNDALCAAELAARTSHEHPDLPWDFHVDLARETWDRRRHAELCDRLMADALGCRWGDHPVDFAAFRDRSGLDLAARLARPAQLPPVTIRPGLEGLERVLEYVRVDEAVYARRAAHWAAQLRPSPAPSPERPQEA